ncbi:MAG: hypothetical protein ACLQNV_03400 [Steroidobacteraceae bacterium]|jgi:hypothetical protein
MTGHAETSHFVFYHDAIRLHGVTAGVSDDQRFHFVDLNTLPIPDYLIVSGLDERLNRALFSEYLGMLSVQPHTKVVGMFTYSVPLKFCRAWAERTRIPEIFLPEITFAKIAAAEFDPSQIYAPEFGHPQTRFAPQIATVHSKFQVGSDRISALGPYKGSFVVSSETYADFSNWFPKVCRYLMEHVDWRIGAGGNSPFTASKYAGKSEDERKVDQMRHGIGGLMERIVAYYFGQRFADRDKHRLGPYLESRLQAIAPTP